MALRPPTATIRTQVALPLRFSDGYATDARLYSKLEAYARQEGGIDTYEANLALGHREDERSYVAAAQMLLALGVSQIALLSNNPDKARQLRSCGVTIVEQVPTGVHLSAANIRYLETKARRGDHMLDFPLPA